MSLDADPEKIADTLYDAYGNRRVNTVMVASGRYDVILEVAKEYQRDPAALVGLYIRSNTGRLVPLSAVTTLTQTVAPLTANHIGQFPAVTFQFDLKPEVTLSGATGIARRAAKEIGMQATIRLASHFKAPPPSSKASSKGLGLLLVIAVMVIYLVRGVLYESFIHPITILSGLPEAAIGALLTLLACGEDLNLYSFLGVILLIGIVKKNAIRRTQ